MQILTFLLKSPFSQKLNITTLYSENWTFFKIHEIEYTPSTMFKRHYIDGIEYPPSPICEEKPQYESNQFIESIPPKRLGVLARKI